MRNLLLLALLWLPTTVLGQAAVDARSSAGYSAIAGATRQSLRGQQDSSAGKRLGVEVFGKHDILSDVLGIDAPREWSVGKCGYSRYFCTISQRVSDNECLFYSGQCGPFLLRGLPTDRVADGVKVILPVPIIISGTYQYTTVLGASKTILVAEYDKEKIVAAAAKLAAKQAVLKHAYEESLRLKRVRKWTDKTGSFTIDAEFLGFESGEVTLLREDTKQEIRIRSAQLSREDQKWLREELQRRRRPSQTSRHLIQG